MARKRSRGGDLPAHERWPGVSIKLTTEGGRYYFDEDDADHACEFFPAFLRHYKGKWKGRPFHLFDWQRELIIRPVFGWKHARGPRKGLRRFRRVFLAVAKKNGKSGLASGLGLYLMACDGEQGAEVYATAADVGQARVVFGESQKFVESGGLAQYAEVFKDAITWPMTASKFQVLSGAPKTKHGPNVSGLILDEVHTQPSRHLYETLANGTIARDQPLVIMLTTAGDDVESFCFEEWEYARQVRDGLITDEELLPVIFEPGRDDRWDDPETWHKANPSLGEAIDVDKLEALAQTARNEPRKRAAFERLHCNRWTGAETIWIEPERWAECRQESEPEDLTERVVCGGLDLAATTDLVAFAALYRKPDERDASKMRVTLETVHANDSDDDERVPSQTLNVNYSIDVRAWFWLPEDRLRRAQEKDRVPYALWRDQGWLRTCGGASIDYDAIARFILDEFIPQHPKLVQVGFDPWHAPDLCGRLLEQGAPMVEVRQGYASLSAPSKLWEALVLSGRLRHDGNPVLSWNMGNTMVKPDANDNIRPVKPKGWKKIDGVVAGITALNRLMVAPAPKSNVYKSRGVKVLRWD